MNDDIQRFAVAQALYKALAEQVRDAVRGRPARVVECTCE